MTKPQDFDFQIKYQNLYNVCKGELVKSIFYLIPSTKNAANNSPSTSYFMLKS